jgi:hypothetical protein
MPHSCAGFSGYFVPFLAIRKIGQPVGMHVHGACRRPHCLANHFPIQVAERIWLVTALFRRTRLPVADRMACVQIREGKGGYSRYACRERPCHPAPAVARNPLKALGDNANCRPRGPWTCRISCCVPKANHQSQSLNSGATEHPTQLHEEKTFPVALRRTKRHKEDSKVSHLIDGLRADVQPRLVFDLCYRLKVNQSAYERGTFL